MFSDIDIKQEIFSRTPKKWHPYIKLARLDRPVGIWLLLLPCYWGIVLASGGIFNIGWQGVKCLFLFTLGAFLMRAAGCVINDLWDIRLDAAVERTSTRPLASGELSVLQALKFLAALLSLSLLILILLPQVTRVLGVLSIFLVLAYPFMKRVTWLPQLFLGFTFNWGVLMGWAAVTGGLGFAPVWLYIGGIFWTLAYDTVYAHQDKEDDALVGIKSTALLFGKESKFYVGLFFAASMGFIFLAKFATDSYALTTPLLAFLPVWQAFWQLRTWEMDKPASCLQIFKSNQAYGWLVLLMLAL